MDYFASIEDLKQYRRALFSENPDTTILIILSVKAQKYELPLFSEWEHPSFPGYHIEMFEEITDLSHVMTNSASHFLEDYRCMEEDLGDTPKVTGRVGQMYIHLPNLPLNQLRYLPRLDVPCTYIKVLGTDYACHFEENIHDISYCIVTSSFSSNELLTRKVFDELKRGEPLNNIWGGWKLSTKYKWNKAIQKWREYLWRPGGPLEARRHAELLQLIDS